MIDEKALDAAVRDAIPVGIAYCRDGSWSVLKLNDHAWKHQKQIIECYHRQRAEGET